MNYLGMPSVAEAGETIQEHGLQTNPSTYINNTWRTWPKMRHIGWIRSKFSILAPIEMLFMRFDCKNCTNAQRPNPP
jgi:hypothetical protein